MKSVHTQHGTDQAITEGPFDSERRTPGAQRGGRFATQLHQRRTDPRAADRDRDSGRPRRRGWFVRRALLTADLIGILLAFALTEALFAISTTEASGGPGPHLSLGTEATLLILGLPIWVLLAKLYGLYDRDEERPAHSTIDDLVGVLHTVTLGVWFLALAAWLGGTGAPQYSKLAVFWLSAIVLIATARAIARALVRRSPRYLQRTLIVGTDPVARLVATKLRQRPEYGVEVRGFVGELTDDSIHSEVEGPVLGGAADLDWLVTELNIERVIIAQLDVDRAELRRVISLLRARDVQIDIVPEPFEAMGPGGSVHMLHGVPIIGLSPMRLSRSSLLLKRGLDVLVSGIGLLILSPLLLLIAARVKIDSRGPVFYRHERLGRGGSTFQLVKFRTMHAHYCRGPSYGGESAEAEFERLMQSASLREEFESSFKLKSDPRVTTFGAFLRRTSLDELPQLWNVLRGDLSLVGPRPIVADELERYGPHVRTLLGLRPGVTGYWQVNGRSDTTYDERVRLDIAYASDWSLGLDLAILAHTARTLVRSPKGAY